PHCLTVYSDPRYCLLHDHHSFPTRRSSDLVIDVKTNTITSCEALIRWNHPTRGKVPPDEFIAVAEETGLIVPMGEWILNQACKRSESTRLNSSHVKISYAVFCLKKKKN